MAWPCRVAQDAEEALALFIAAGSRYKAGPKRSAAQKLADPKRALPPDEYTWRNDTLRLMFPGARHSVSLFWETTGAARRLLRYFVNLEEPFRRTAVGFDTQDHTLDVVVTPELEPRWRDEAEFESHVALGFFTPELADAVRTEGRRVIEAIARGDHPCLQGWAQWSPDRRWAVPAIPAAWDTTPPTSWDRRDWAYGA
jgi:predicted RNA-binding protein associated with RNAse of E/G family